MLKPGTLALTGVLALLQAMGPISTDTYLPSLPSIAVRLDAPVSTVQLTLSAFLVGFAIAQIVYGPFSDRYGRKPVLMIALSVFAVATLVCALASSIEVLIGARFLQALGAAGPVVLSRSIVRDLYEGRRAGTELSRMATIMGVMPAIAPTFGGFLDAWFGWRSTFVTVFLLGAAITALVVFALPETLRERTEERLTMRTFFSGFAPVIADRGYRVYVAIVCFTYAGIFSFVSASSFVFQSIYGVSPIGFGMIFGLCAIAYVSGTLLGQRLLKRLGVGQALGVGCAFLAFGGLAMIAALAVGFDEPAAIFIPSMIYMMGVGQTLPLAMAAALMPFAKRAGSASSLLGFVQMVFAALVGAAIGIVLGDSAWPLALFLAVCGCAAAATYALTRSIRAAGAEW